MDNRKEKLKGMREAELIEICSGGDVKELAKYPHWTSEVYGFGKLLREYGYYPKSLPLYISTDHGPGQHDFPNSHELNSKMPVHFYHSSRLVECWKKISNKPCEVLYSPFVFYRRKNGITKSADAKGTIAFPAKGTHDIDVIVNWNEYIDQLFRLPEKYHPISVCLYFLDVQKGLHKVFIKRGIPVYTAGHWLNENFIENFYSIVRNFRFATSNCAGSYLFYCIEMSIPFFLYGSEVEKFNKGNVNVVQGKYKNSVYKQMRKIESLFSTVTDNISEEQSKVVVDELGINDGISRFQLSIILYKSYFKGGITRIILRLKRLLAFAKKVSKALVRGM